MNLNHDHSGHRIRLKQRFLKEGNFDKFEPHNILEYLLFNTIPIRDTNDTAHRLLKHFGSLSAVFDAPYSELVKVEGIGPHTATLIKAVLPMARAYSRDKDNVGVILDCTDKYIEFVKEKYIGYNEEVFSIVCMDNSYKVLSWTQGKCSRLFFAPMLPVLWRFTTTPADWLSPQRRIKQLPKP